VTTWNPGSKKKSFAEEKKPRWDDPVSGEPRR